MKIPIHVLSREPLVVVSVGGPELDATLDALDAATSDRYAVLCQIWWSLEVELPVLLRRHRRIAPKHPRARLVYLANTPAEVELLRACGLRATLCNHNAFVDEERFAVAGPRAERRPKHRAIYNAALSPYKRHALACEVEGLALVTYFLEVVDAPPDYPSEMHALLRGATWLNFEPPDRFRWLDASVVAEHVAASGAGLCLSREEGAMFASIEYLLAGIPVVTTPSIGGREQFFDEACALFVDEAPAAVARGVDEVLRWSVSPGEIRARALARMNEHRKRFDAIVEEVASDLGGAVAHDGRIRGGLVHRMFAWETPARVRELVAL